ANAPRRQEATQFLAALAHILQFPAVFRRAIERGSAHVLVRDRDAEARAELFQLFLVELLLLVADVASLAGLAHAVALDGLGQDDGRRAAMLHRGLESGVDLLRV